MTRLEALKAAREHVNEMWAEKNSKGYTIHSPSPQERLAAELTVARFLIDEWENE